MRRTFGTVGNNKPKLEAEVTEYTLIKLRLLDERCRRKCTHG